MEKIKIIIDNKELEAKKGQTILEAAKENGIEIPALCFHPDLNIKANCRICLIEIKGKKGLLTACSTKAERGMEVITESPEIRKARKINLELIFGQHCEECGDCVRNHNCRLLDLAQEYGIKSSRFSDRKAEFPCYNFDSALVYDSSKCIDCRNCVEACARQNVHYLEVKKNKSFYEVVPSENPKRDCIYCGQCLVHCPVGAFEAVGESEDVEKPLQDKNKFVIFQFAPAVRTSIGEEFGMTAGAIVTEKLVGAIKKLGVNKVFDVSVGADFTTIEEAKELIERKPSELPVLSSCCPAWVKFVEFYHPEFIPNIATTRSPHIFLGSLIKSYFAEKEKLDPKNIVVVSVMPCVAKKYEVIRDELRINGLKPVDYVLTTRELAFLLKKKNIDFKTAKEEKPDIPFGVPSGAGVIYGATGGVMESALRTAYEKINGRPLKNFNLKEVRGQKAVKAATLKLGGKKIKVAVVNGLDKIEEILADIRKKPGLYHCVEVMACRGGCVGGGGQPVPVSDKIRAARAKSLYNIDDKAGVRLAHKNPVVEDVYRNFLTSEEKIKFFCHTKYSKKLKEN